MKKKSSFFQRRGKNWKNDKKIEEKTSIIFYKGSLFITNEQAKLSSF
jgi:hypothetical protein